MPEAGHCTSSAMVEPGECLLPLSLDTERRRIEVAEYMYGFRVGVRGREPNKVYSKRGREEGKHGEIEIAERIEREKKERKTETHPLKRWTYGRYSRQQVYSTGKDIPRSCPPLCVLCRLLVALCVFSRLSVPAAVVMQCSGDWG